MRYISTRGQTQSFGFSDAVATGLAPDGGLFLPETLPSVAKDCSCFQRLSYAAMCFEFLKVFATDTPPQALRTTVPKSYRTFSCPEIAPLIPLTDKLHVL